MNRRRLLKMLCAAPAAIPAIVVANSRPWGSGVPAILDSWHRTGEFGVEMTMDVSTQIIPDSIARIAANAARKSFSAALDVAHSRSRRETGKPDPVIGGGSNYFRGEA